MRVYRIFRSLQGEGANTGVPAVFVRFYGCNLDCTFCDTPMNSWVEKTEEEIFDRVIEVVPGGRRRVTPNMVVFTGGEPGQELTASLVQKFNRVGMVTAIETNGTIATVDSLPLGYVSCSPKIGYPVTINRVHELRYPINICDPIPRVPKRFDMIPKFLSPIVLRGSYDKENLLYCIQLAQQNPGWGISLQMHKIWGVK